MKTNPSCTDPNCPKEFPEKQNFCNLCGAPLVLVEAKQTSQEDYFKTVISSGSLESKKTFSSEEARNEPEDILQLPQEPFDPMKTMIASSEASPYFEQQEKIFDIPESGELKAPGISKPSEPPSPYQDIEKPYKESSLVQPKTSPSITEESPIDLPENKPSTLSETLPEIPTVISPTYEPHAPFSSNIEEEPPKTIIEPSVEPKFPYEPPSPFASKPPEIKPSFTEEQHLPKTQVFDQPNTFFESSQQPLREPLYEAPKPKEFTPKQSWTPPPPPSPSWHKQPIGSGTPFRPPAGETNQTLAITSLILGILGLLCCGLLTGIPAMIIGFMAKSRAESQPLLYGGRGMAIAGIILGALSTILGLIGLIYVLLGFLSAGIR
ncbi:MAG: DUF4190 domain-containing protein [Pyrinomonadaceae bacterium]|nr:DUF4190 domain-containing protein [Pyrinomonadaceae bacterium]MCX7640698.1 DUF4190 domain-containing protein [Pyrinomonadaceae bacterium]MDW8305402.1 DUF4190 domain-containing protein [Acidobacteriota bacterium]